jgi:hypothetical protein
MVELSYHVEGASADVPPGVPYFVFEISGVVSIVVRLTWIGPEGILVDCHTSLGLTMGATTFLNHEAV